MKEKSSIPVSHKIVWGMGGFTENLSINVIPSLAYNIFQVGMGISPAVIGIALGASRFFEAITDPLIGHLSDNTRSRWGRRRPWIFFGAIIMTIIFISVWFTPRSVADIQIIGLTIKGSFLQAAYLVATVSLFFMTFTIWQIPFSGLGLELEVDYNKRTSLQIFKIIPSYMMGTLIGSLYYFTQMKSVWGGDEITGSRYMSLVIGSIILLFGVLPAIICRERFEIKHEKVKFWPSFLETFKDRPFKLLMGAIFFVFVGLYFMIPLLGYITLYHVGFDGIHRVPEWTWGWGNGSWFPVQMHMIEKNLSHKELAGILGIYTGIVQTGTQLLSILVINKVAKYYDKKTVLIAGLIVGILGYCSSWYLFTPAHPFLAILPPVIINIGLSACWVLIGSFCADICDYDESKTGQRREGMYSAVTGFLIKLSMTFVITITSMVLIVLGIKGKDPQLSVDQLTSIRFLYILVPVLSMIIAVLFVWTYPLTKKMINEIQEGLVIARKKSQSMTDKY